MNSVASCPWRSDHHHYARNADRCPQQVPSIRPETVHDDPPLQPVEPAIGKEDQHKAAILDHHPRQVRRPNEVATCRPRGDVIQQQPPDSYIAVLDRSPFWEPGVLDLMERGSFHLVLRWPQGQR